MPKIWKVFQVGLFSWVHFYSQTVGIYILYYEDSKLSSVHKQNKNISSCFAKWQQYTSYTNTALTSQTRVIKAFLEHKDSLLLKKTIMLSM